MMIIDTHIWIWWVHGSNNLSPWMQNMLDVSQEGGIGVSVMSCVEVACAAATGGLELDRPVEQWMKQALDYPGVQLLELTPEICLDAYRLPEPFHRDPGDRLIVATARILDIPLMTADGKILHYPHVQTARPSA